MSGPSNFFPGRPAPYFILRILGPQMCLGMEIGSRALTTYYDDLKT